MTAPTRYVLDANVFIEAKRRYYAFDLCPGFWDALIWHHARLRLCSIDRVRVELEYGADDLARWVKTTVPNDCFVSTADADVVGWFGQMVAWVQAQTQYQPQAKADFASKADGWLIALAKARGLILVTHEEPAPDARRTVPMPNVCQQFQVPFVDTFEMLRDLKTAFNWHAPA